MNVYLFQISYSHGKSTFLPYTVGTLVANAKCNKDILKHYTFKPFIFLREDPDKIINQLDSPSVCAFSNYIWNHEFNKILAKKIKEKYPNCFIIFGGHQISVDDKLLRENDFIDALIFGEGEETFSSLLIALKNNFPLSTVSNIAYRDNNKFITTKREISKRTDFPSPYLTGLFDYIIKDYPDIDFHAILETNRGCPYGCTYCDWGNGNLKCEMRLFPEERVFGELRWLSDHGIHLFGFADSNFGMFERDERFVDEMIRLKKEYGVLKEFQTSYAKNSNERVFSITKKLNDCGMNKGATISFQSMNDTVLENIHRKNISVDTFTKLMEKYNNAGIATYSELILGLPGETLNSLITGIDSLLNSGQHNAIYIHNCEWLPCAPMGEEEYIKKHGIKTVKIPLNQPHRLMKKNEITEYSRLIIETNSMSREVWVKMNIYSAVAQAFHHEGLLMMFSLYLHHEKGIKYSEFYTKLIDFLFAHPKSVGGSSLSQIKQRFENVSRGEDCPVFVDNRFGDVGWPVEEYLFLSIAYNIDDFYSEIQEYLSPYFDDSHLFKELMNYQRKILKLPFTEKIEINCCYNFNEYFSDLLKNGHGALLMKQCNYSIEPIRCNCWQDYARYIIWYGRKDSRNIYL